MLKIALKNKRNLGHEIKKIRRHDFTKELKDFEFETKFQIINHDSAQVFLKKIERCFKNSARFILCKISSGDKLLTKVYFHVKNGAEHSLFKYRGARMLKVKKHKVLKYGALPIFKNDEKLLIDRGDFEKHLNKWRYRFRRHKYSLVDLGKTLEKLGVPPQQNMITMAKLRLKDFVLDAEDGRIYAISVTFCKSRGRIQKQMEVEYAGFLPNFGIARMGSEKEIIKKTIELSDYIYKRLTNDLHPSIERKYEFVKKVYEKTK